MVAPPLPHQTLSHVLSLTPGQVDAMANRVLDYFEEAHKTIDTTPEARSLFLAYQASWNVQAAVRREHEQGAGRLGTAAWHLGILAAASLVFEVATGDVAWQPGSPDLCVESRHIMRAHRHVCLSHDLINIWSAKDASPEGFCRPDRGPVAYALSAVERLRAAAAAGPLQAPPFAPTQQAPGEASEAGVAQMDDMVKPPEKEAQKKQVLQLNDSDVPSLKWGLGPDGSSVQDPVIGQVVHPDRVILQKTLMRGETTIYGRLVADSIAVKMKAPGQQTDSGGAKYSRTSLKLSHWKAVVSEAMQQERIGEFIDGPEEGGKKDQPRLVLHLPPSDNEDAIIEFHNRLMRLCCMPYEALMEKIRSKEGKVQKPKKSGEPPSKAVEPPEVQPARSQSLGVSGC